MAAYSYKHKLNYPPHLLRKDGKLKKTAAAQKEAREFARAHARGSLQVKESKRHIPNTNTAPVYSYSITIHKTKYDKRPLNLKLIDLLHVLSRHYFNKSLFSIERGKVQRRLHIQGVFQCNAYFKRCDSIVHVNTKNIRIFIQKFLGITSPDYHITIKHLHDSQHFVAMLGYCSKDHNSKHYIQRLHRVTECDLIEGRRVYFNFFKHKPHHRQNGKVVPDDVTKASDTLGLNLHDLSKRNVTVAYRKLALHHHPNKPNGNANMFRCIKSAHDVLQSFLDE